MVVARLGRFEVRREIGRGAMGVVYEGFDPAIGRRIAIKTLRTEVFEPAELPNAKERFKREARAAGRLTHPNVVTIHEYGEDGNVPYIAMEFMTGIDLGALLSRGARFHVEEIARIASQLLGALASAHDQGIIHRDVKPANMFLLDDGALKIVDFGIAHLDSSGLTRTGAIMGTPAYMSPEQVIGLQVGPQSDIFSAGVVLYQLLTGDRPFTGSAHTIGQKILHSEPPPPSTLNPMLSPVWDQIVAKAMRKDYKGRFASAREFSDAIRNVPARFPEQARESEAGDKSRRVTSTTALPATPPSLLRSVAGTNSPINRNLATIAAGVCVIAVALIVFLPTAFRPASPVPAVVQAPLSVDEDKLRREIETKVLNTIAAKASLPPLTEEIPAPPTVAKLSPRKSDAAAPAAPKRPRVPEIAPATTPQEASALGEAAKETPKVETKPQSMEAARISGSYPFQFTNLRLTAALAGSEAILSFVLLYEGAGENFMGVRNDASATYRMERARKNSEGTTTWFPVSSTYLSTNLRLRSAADSAFRVALVANTPMTPGTQIPVTFLFKNAGAVTVIAEVR